MRNLPLPAIDHRALYRRCAEQTQAAADRQVLLNMADRIVAAGVGYGEAARRSRLDTVATIAMSNDERHLASQLYNRRMANINGSGRGSYDQIRASSPFCPYCTFGEVCEIDHFLPKGAFPDLNVLPDNLVPICHRCNHIKLEAMPLGPHQSLLHPYFDILPHRERWLFADMSIENEGPVLSYRVQLNEDEFGLLARRLSFHFDQLRLDRRFSERAATILAELESDIAEFLNALAPDVRATHFESVAERTFHRHGNTLEAAAYFAAAQSPQYCEGAWRN